jgi:carbonic anhydrase/acetyltransferase-like protein (isoleucine patch superfamily)
MSLLPYQDFSPKLAQGVYISPGAWVIGRATLEKNVSIWFNTVVRADVNQIIIGENSNIQDLCMLHVTEQNDLVIGKNVSLGHSVILHACKIGDSCLIGMGAIVLDGAEIGENSVVAAGSVVPPGKKFPAGSMIKGNPAVVTRELSSEEKMGYGNHYKSYVGYKDIYLLK